MNNAIFSRIIKTWLIVGTLDITGASIQFYIKTGKGPVPIFKYIASALFGADARTGGTGMIIAGFVFHYIIALLFTVFFFIVFSKLKFPVLNRIVIGVLYGVFIWFVMSHIVLPLSAIGISTKPSDPVNELIAASILIVCIGIPLSLLAPKPEKEKLIM